MDSKEKKNRIPEVLKTFSWDFNFSNYKSEDFSSLARRVENPFIIFSGPVPFFFTPCFGQGLEAFLVFEF